MVGRDCSYLNVWPLPEMMFTLSYVYVHWTPRTRFAAFMFQITTSGINHYFLWCHTRRYDDGRCMDTCLYRGSCRCRCNASDYTIAGWRITSGCYSTMITHSHLPPFFRLDLLLSG